MIFDSPHSGRDYPADFRPLVPLVRLFGYEDRLVDALLAGAPEAGIVLIAAGFPRSYVDPNRAEGDVDAAMVGENWARPLEPSAYAGRGLGLFFATGLDGEPLYDAPLGTAAAERRIDAFWRPYHAALETELAAAQRRWGAVWHIDWHSMRPTGNALAPDHGRGRPDFVVGDLDGRSADPAFSGFAVRELERLGYSVARNDPFKGGYITALHGRPEEGRHSIQIEINRGLYLDMETLQPSEGWEKLQRDLDSFACAAAGFVSERLSAS